MFTQEQTEQIKQQIIEQIESNFPNNEKEPAKKQILSMNPKELESFLNQNNLINQKENKCIFCSIISGDISSYKIEENNKAIAVLEINPISKGHCLIIPKDHESSINDSEIQNFVKKVSEKIKKLNPKEIKIFSQNLFGHEIINILPVYSKENPDSKRTHANTEELEEIQKILEKSEEPPIIEKKLEKEETEETNQKEKIRLPRRIP